MTTALIQPLIVGPVLIPLLAAAVVALLRRHDAVARVATAGSAGVLTVAILPHSRDTPHSARPPNPFRQPWSGWVLRRSS